MPDPASAVSVRLSCEDCGASGSTHSDDAHALLRELRTFVAAHAECSFSVGINLVSAGPRD